MRIKILSLLPIILLSACSSTGESSSSYAEHTYEEVVDLQITYDKSFSISENDHFIYFYQETCHSCQEIKDEVIDFAINKYAEIYFVAATEEIPHNYDYQEINQTLGSSNVEDVFVGVTPQLALIKNGKIEKNIINPIYIEEELSHYRD